MRILSSLVVAVALGFSSVALAVDIGSMAPDFSAQASNGKTVKLSDYKGKIVLLEWANHGCPFVKKHYESHHMQNLQKEYTGKGVVWLTVISSAKGKQGYATPAQAEADKAKFGAMPTAVLLDEKGTLGKLYDAQTTPHIFVVNEKGQLAYQGAADDQPSTDVADFAKAHDYIKAALDAVLAKQPVKEAQTKSYGCGVKY